MAALTDEQREELDFLNDGNVDAALARIDEVERAQAEHTGSMISISHALQQAEDRAAELETVLADFETKVVGEVTRLTKERDGCNSEIAAWRETSAAQSRETGQLHDALGKAEAEIERLRGDVAALWAMIDAGEYHYGGRILKAEAIQALKAQQVKP